jgi:hypothetical protein
MSAPALVDLVPKIFGTAAETVRRAREKVGRRELAAHRFPDSFADELDELRAPRTFAER